LQGEGPSARPDQHQGGRAGEGEGSGRDVAIEAAAVGGDAKQAVGSDRAGIAENAAVQDHVAGGGVEAPMELLTPPSERVVMLKMPLWMVLPPV